ncbi:PIG-L deacetylase family protein [Chroogloeocystis siderophila]|jgi:LmbE family N-acetylglucosaminyl deacetylase|uniref:PIG-L domain-containing protein n=1 Tax=Chroogloeocystis siderophila 5.2 s.c.1 TaxID=247279 RepID=A0A1U7HZM5_9CHRO|nr:PIG-L deacetylase family protein [Chroogloeocystis siderophila]OKH29057.1 PIG-L domain-containing protein [Chroogloeocystis siderophila 5.2 s.c.1]
MTQIVSQALLAPEQIPLYPASAIADFGSTLIVAPHPDDESLGCGGAIALLQQLGVSVEVLIISDGTRSHPNSRRYPAPALRDLRESETRAALAVLGDKVAVTFFCLQDGAVPNRNSADFNFAVTRLRDYLSSRDVQTIFLPWRFDPHPDHRATWELLTTAIDTANLSLRQIEYLIWDWDPLQRKNSNLPPNIKPWRLDIGTVVDLKQQAITAYRSQTTDLIDDDPEGFRLTPEMLANFAHPWELYLEQT